MGILPNYKRGEEKGGTSATNRAFTNQLIDFHAQKRTRGETATNVWQEIQESQRVLLAKGECDVTEKGKVRRGKSQGCPS